MLEIRLFKVNQLRNPDTPVFSYFATMLKNNKYLLEWCIDDAIASLPHFHKVDQVEWCSRLDMDGLTPDLALASQVFNNSPVPVKIMLRNRAGDFVYSKKEVDEMIETGLRFRELGFDRFVFGAIRHDRLDMDSIDALAEALAPAHICIHKAIDVSVHLIEDLKLLGEIQGIHEVLSSGGAATAIEGAAKLKEMFAIAPTGITLIGAGKITRENVEQHHELLGLSAYHGKRMA